MGNAKKAKPIHLTNRTAVGLRKIAQRVRGLWLVAMGVVTMITTVAAVTLGMTWLPAVPLTLIAGGCVIGVMMIVSRSSYLLLISQAICTEAASRQMDEQSSENQRRRRAIEQLAAMRADMREAERRGISREGMRSEESLLFDLLTGNMPGEEENLRQRRAEEDEELYAASEMDEDDGEGWEVDLHPPRKNRNAAAYASAPVQTGSTRPVVQPVPAQSGSEESGHSEDALQDAGVRRRRRSAGSASLQLIRNQQAQ